MPSYQFRNFHGGDDIDFDYLISTMEIIKPIKHLCDESDSGGYLNIKMLFYQYRDPHIKDKTVSQPSYL